MSSSPLTARARLPCINRAQSTNAFLYGVTIFNSKSKFKRSNSATTARNSLLFLSEPRISRLDFLVQARHCSLNYSVIFVSVQSVTPARFTNYADFVATVHINPNPVLAWVFKPRLLGIYVQKK